MEEHFTAYCKCRNEESENMDEIVADDLEADAKTALEAFLALFADHEEFQDETAAEEFLQAGISTIDMRYVDKFCAWIDELLNQYHAQNSPLVRVGNSPPEISMELEPFVSAMKADTDYEGQRRPSLWPVVRIVR